ncbi:hypothetical protein PINS_up003101 [Pythium insidiosum]|nr:hypothetical protein PINS_up003101 [Pythium insidiosum]
MTATQQQQQAELPPQLVTKRLSGLQETIVLADSDTVSASTGSSSGSARAASSRTSLWIRGLLLAALVGGVLVVQHTMLSSMRFDQRPSAISRLLAETRALRREAASAEVPEAPEALEAVETPQQKQRRLAVKAAMQHTWRHYEERAFGADEIAPVSGVRRDDVWGNVACTLVDALDTLWIMDMKDEFQRARDYVAERLDFTQFGVTGAKYSVFETIIRELGGLLSAYDLSRDVVFKAKAHELMELLAPAFEPKEGIFYTYFNPISKEKSLSPWSPNAAHIADVGTLQLETRRVSDITGNQSYAAMGEAFYQIVRRLGSFNRTGLFPVHFDPRAGQFATRSKITIGALADSFYEYLLKVHIYSGKRRQDAYLRKMYDAAVDGMESLLQFHSEPDDLYFLQEINLPGMQREQRMDHLLCFVPGTLALGTIHDKDARKNARHLKLAKRLMDACYQMYHKQPTGLSPDVVEFPPMMNADRAYRLRPETIESLFYLYRVTKDQKYRERGWEIFQSLEKHAKAPFGFAAVQDVTVVPAPLEDKQESFFLAETLKYHYLLQCPDNVIPLDKYVFNTEAHPLLIQQ